jgi:hypothetical protein
MGISGKLLVICLATILIGAVSTIWYLDNNTELSQHLCQEYSGFLKSPETVNSDELMLTVPRDIIAKPVQYDPAPTAYARDSPGFDLLSNYYYVSFYENNTGVIKIFVRNIGTGPVFIDGYGAKLLGNDIWFDHITGVIVQPGEEKDLGLLCIQVPENTDTIVLKPYISLFAKTESGEWFNYEDQLYDEIEVEVKPLQEQTYPAIRYNQRDLFIRTNDIVDPLDPSVREIATSLATKYPGEYNIYQVCAIFDYIKENIQYVSDPRGVDQWSAPGDTLKIGAGDCDDYAILLASMIESIGGTTRIYMTDTHAFATVYIGSGEAAENIVKAISSYYGPVTVYYATDDNGSWVILDPTSSMYAGGLPGGTAPTSNGWTYMNTSTVDIIDIVPEL